jgi:superfamily II DNA or RNA helicase
MTAASGPNTQIPEVGQAVQVRNRLATIRAVDAYDSRDVGRMHLVDVEYLDDFRFPASEQLLWEIETTGRILGQTSLPSVDVHAPDDPSVLQSFVNAHNWTRLNRLRDPDKPEDEPLLGVWNSAIQIHPYQMESVLRALSMPRVSLLLADGVGLGKTIQSGLVLEELLLRRRVRRILVICPALLQRQWKYELRRRFNLDFEIIDADTTFELRRKMGIDTNPWRAFPRVIASMDYLRMPDVLQAFLQGSGVGTDDTQARHGRAHAPWDLLIVDECHHFAPQNGTRASHRTNMLREIRFLFEHRIFASATPHNGKTTCFTGLLELLDPVRFRMTSEMNAKDLDNLSAVRVRRLKDDINRQSLHPPFANQLEPVALPFKLTADEAALFSALREYRRRGYAALRKVAPSERWVGQFMFALLTKRLLSCPLAFARTWWRHLANSSVETREDLFELARLAAQKAEETASADAELGTLEEDAARHGRAWLRSQDSELDSAQQLVSSALDRLGLGRDAVEDVHALPALARKSDSKTDALVQWIKTNLFADGKLRDDERLIVFTEYKESLQYLEARLLREGFDPSTLHLLFGGMGSNEFESVKSDFEDPGNAVRLLLATDAASEGINMQESCRWIIHYDIPWSPSRILQRNGRVSRHGQMRDVSIHFFRCDEEEDIQFLYFIAQKVDRVRNDLGSVEPVFDSAIQRHFSGEKTASELDQIDLFVRNTQAASKEAGDLGVSRPEELKKLMQHASELLKRTESRLNISPAALARLLEAALTVEGAGKLEPISGRSGFYRLTPPPSWESLVKQTLTVGSSDRMEIVFDAALVEEEINGRRLLRLKKYQTLLRLGHPVMRQAIATLTRQLHDPTASKPIFRWSVAALHQSGFDALLVLHYTLTVINDLHEPLHDEVRTEVFRVEGDTLSAVEPTFRDQVARSEFLAIQSPGRLEHWVKTIRANWPSHRSKIEATLKEISAQSEAVFQARAGANLRTELESTRESYHVRLAELQDRRREQELNRLAADLLKQQAAAQQPALFEDINAAAKLKSKELEDQIAILRRDVDHTRELLTHERETRTTVLLPKRFKIHEVRVLPLALVYLIPAAAEDLAP